MIVRVGKFFGKLTGRSRCRHLSGAKLVVVATFSLSWGELNGVESEPHECRKVRGTPEFHPQD